ncbi:hypothetical protein hrd7_07370 [Leptolinea sp. HRD-7]|nr:hypothetical protein hrd7_07370 [Leptolinea sp. HRD-7]
MRNRLSPRASPVLLRNCMSDLLTSQVAAHEEFTATSQMGDVNRLTGLFFSLTCLRQVLYF